MFKLFVFLSQHFSLSLSLSLSFSHSLTLGTKIFFSQSLEVEVSQQLSPKTFFLSSISCFSRVSCFSHQLISSTLIDAVTSKIIFSSQIIREIILRKLSFKGVSSKRRDDTQHYNSQFKDTVFRVLFRT